MEKALLISALLSGAILADTMTQPMTPQGGNGAEPPCTTDIGEMRPSPLFRPHMVLPAGKPLKVFGTGDGTAVVRLNGATARCVSSNGTWCATLPPQSYGGPYSLVMDFDGRTVTCDDVYVGEVYILAGQSNMQFKLEESTTPAESYADVPLMRSFTTPRPEPEPYSPEDGWVVCTRENAGKWSAIGYLFGKAVSERKGIAVGIVNCYQGAATVETWMPAALSERPEFSLPREEQDPAHWGYPWNKAGWMYDHAFQLLAGAPVSGVVWYQGESNSGTGEHKVYAELVAELVKQWRRDLLDDNLPFAVVQIADLDVRRDDAWRGIQEAQLRIPKLCHGVTVVKCADICETDTIHPPTKGPLAERLAAWAMSEVKPPSLASIITAKHKTVSRDVWHGHSRTVFDFKGHTAWIAEPEGEWAAGHPWTWTMQWADAFVERTGVLDLLAKGWRHVHIDTFAHRMDEEGLRVSRAFQKYLVEELGFAPKASLVGMSWGGFFSVRYAAAFPDCVARIYLDAPLLTFAGGFGATDGAPLGAAAEIGPWAAMPPKDGDWFADPRMPVNMAEAVAKARIPILLLYGGQDQTVLPKFNCEPFAERFRAAGGDIRVDKRGGYGHHPHGEEHGRTSIIADFLEGVN